MPSHAVGLADAQKRPEAHRVRDAEDVQFRHLSSVRGGELSRGAPAPRKRTHMVLRRASFGSREGKSGLAAGKFGILIVLWHRVDRSKYLNFAIRRHSSARLAGLVTKCRAWGAAMHAGGHPCQLSVSSTMTAIS